MVSGGITPTPTYDGNGNQTSAIPATLTWNALNQPITVNSTTATYDALGRMVEKGVSGTYTQFVCNSRTAIGLQFGWSGIVSGTVVAPNNGTPQQPQQPKQPWYWPGGPPLTCLKSVGAPSFAYFAEGGLRQPSTNGSRCKLVSGYTGT